MKVIHKDHLCQNLADKNKYLRSKFCLILAAYDGILLKVDDSNYDNL